MSQLAEGCAVFLYDIGVDRDKEIIHAVFLPLWLCHDPPPPLINLPVLPCVKPPFTTRVAPLVVIHDMTTLDNSRRRMRPL